jgi:acetyl-CoA synthetase
MLAAMKLGAVLIPATTLLSQDDLRDRIERGDVKHAVIGEAHADKLEGLAQHCTRICVGGPREGWQRFDYSGHAAEFAPQGVTKATDPLLLYFTSGTTSKPKLVLHSHQSYPVGHLSTMFWIGLQPGDIHLNISSPGWAKHAWSCFFAPWNAGACIFLYNYSRFNAKSMLGVLERYQVTTMCAPPTVWRMMIQENLAEYRDRLKLRELIGAGEPLNPEIIEQVRNAWNITLRDGFGQTETTAQIGNSPAQAVKPGSMGRPLPGYRIALLDIDDREAAEGEVCLVLNPAPTGLMLGYMDSQEKTAEVMRNGYYRTGDVASRDSDGYITYVGRADDVFKASDYRISPFELESVLIEHPAIVEAAVVPSPDPVRLAVPKAFIVLRQDYEPSRELAKDIFAFLRNHLAAFKRIRIIEFSELPKTISGKIRRVDLRKLEAAQRGNAEKGAMEFFEEDFPELKN